MTATKQERNAETLASARLVVLLGGPAGRPDDCRVEDPGRVLRMYALLSTLNEELHEVTLPPRALPDLQRQLDAVRSELEQSVSGALARELRRLTSAGPGQKCADELRVECVSLLGWAGGLVVAMLNQIETIPRGPARPEIKTPAGAAGGLGAAGRHRSRSAPAKRHVRA
jgi:hypothetical protein